ncbi:hypothetical protein, partial [Dactylosporangium sp. NPDC000521]|uniref:hypothetical protein n=1 Tax=Dactylosporangium sp. NPDC000521 TaxID=3363975 RepID=UPI0036C43DDB
MGRVIEGRPWPPGRPLDDFDHEALHTERDEPAVEQRPDRVRQTPQIANPAASTRTPGAAHQSTHRDRDACGTPTATSAPQPGNRSASTPAGTSAS